MISSNNKFTNYRYLPILISFFLLISVSFTIYGEDELISEEFPPVLDFLNRDDGLSNLSVSSIVEDKYGILWFGTQGGLNRYDGQTITTYRSNPFTTDGLLHNLLQTLTYDEVNHELWIGTYQGVSRYNIHEDTFTNYTVTENNLSNEIVVSITFDKGSVWVGTLDGLNKINPITHEIEIFPIPEKVVRKLFVASDKKLYIGTYDGLYYFDETSNSVVKMPLELPTPFVMTIDEFQDGILTIGMWDGGIANINLDTTEVSITNFEDNRVYSLLKTNDGTLWVGTWGGGLFAIDKSNNKYHYPGTGKENDLPHNVVYSLFQSKSDILWIGTNGGGIVKINPRKRNYVFLKNSPDNPKGLSNGKINLLYRDLKDQLWIAVYNTGIERYDEETGELYKYHGDANPIVGNNITSAIELDADTFLIGSEVGLFIYNYLEDKFMPYNIGIEPKFIYALEKQDDTLWVGTYKEGLFAYNLKTKDLIQYGLDKENSLSDNLVYDIHVDSKNRLWVATNNGLNLMVAGENTFTSFHKVSEDTTQLPNNNTRTIFEDDKNRIWIGTGGGLSLYDEENNNFRTFTEAQGLSNNMILAILQHDDGDIWVSTSDGLSIIDSETFVIETLSPEDGIGSYEFNSGHLKEDSGILHFAGAHGITSIPVDFSTPSTIALEMYIANVEVFQNPIKVPRGFFNSKHLTFEPNENMLTFNFLALDYDAPDKINYYYKLEPLSDAWIHSGTNNYITYSNLKPGEYTLWVYAESSRGVSSEAVHLHFKILKPWYLSWMAFVVYFILLALLIYMIIKLKESNKLRAANVKLEELSIKDSLTGVYNRRYFEDIMEQHLQLAKRSSVPMGILMVDIDDFKNINDTKGHLAGDEVLKNIAHTIENLLQRSTDFVARYGGDEFAVGLYNTSIEGVLEIARSIQEGISSSPVTLSIGAHSHVPSETETVSDLIDIADHCLYDSKAHGKNRISYDHNLLHPANQ